MIHFIFCPDSSSVRSARRLVAHKSPALGVVFGTWHELVNLAASCWLLPTNKNDWQQQLETHVTATTNSFWSASLKAVPSETTAITGIIDNTLATLLEGNKPGVTLLPPVAGALPSRTVTYLTDLAYLHESMGRVLPPHLAVIRSLLDLPSERMLRPLMVYSHPDLPPLNPWQSALIEKLNQTAGDVELPELASLLAPIGPSAPISSALGHLQRTLFERTSQKKELDDSVQWLAVRDYLLEIEVCAGMVQQALADDPSLQYADIALLLPADQTYYGPVANTFGVAGIPLSGLACSSSARDLGREAVSLLLTCLDGLSPVMALASLVVSPLMPWNRVTANRLAQQAIVSNFRMELPDDASETAQTMARLIRTRITTSAQLKTCLTRFPDLLSQAEELLQHREQAETVCAKLTSLLDESASGPIPWHELKVIASPQAHPVQQQAKYTLQGVAVFHEGEEPWRPVRRMFVLGCSDGHYPRPSSKYSFFTDNELEQIRSCCGCQLVTVAEKSRLLRQQFRRKLCSASEQVTFLLPRRDPAGKTLTPSAAVTFSAALFTGVDDAEGLVLELDSETERNTAIGLPHVPDQRPVSPRQPEPHDLKFDKNLLELDQRADGSLKPESPSRLEKLMVSPLAWLLERLGVEPLEWQPETLDVMSKGTLAHAVFELLFAPEVPLPDSDQIENQVPELLESLITAQMPFLNRGEWEVERKHLQQDILKAAQQWRDILRRTGARPIAVEIGLQGVFEGIPIHGNADLLLELAPDRLYVVDYKKSASGDRRKRMKAGYDHQAQLYRTMIRTGGLKEPGKAPAGLADKLGHLRDNGEIGTLYYLLNDQTGLADTTGWLPGSTGNPEEMNTETSSNAMQLIKYRFTQVRNGWIELNTQVDEKEFKDKRGISAYALKGNPLVAMWMK